MVCPASYVAEVGEIVGVPRAELTLTKSVGLSAVLEAESVTI